MFVRLLKKTYIMSKIYNKYIKVKHIRATESSLFSEIIWSKFFENMEIFNQNVITLIFIPLKCHCFEFYNIKLSLLWISYYLIVPAFDFILSKCPCFEFSAIKMSWIFPYNYQKKHIEICNNMNVIIYFLNKIYKMSKTYNKINKNQTSNIDLFQNFIEIHPNFVNK